MNQTNLQFKTLLLLLALVTVAFIWTIARILMDAAVCSVTMVSCFQRVVTAR